MAALIVKSCFRLSNFTNLPRINRHFNTLAINANYLRCASSNGVKSVNQAHTSMGRTERRLTSAHRVRPLSTGICLLHQQPAEEETTKEANYHSIIKNTEKEQGPSDKREFLAETRMLLDIVAKSLYSEKEVFIRELISNASDALEKLRYLRLTTANAAADSVQLAQEARDEAKETEIHIATDKMDRTFIIQDTGIGMTKDEMIQSLGTIARSGSKVLHSQRLRETPLKTWFIAGVNGTILSAHCTCMAGLDECCTHVAALLFYVEYAVRYREHALK